MPTIKDVAKAAGVSVAMVSKALNDYPDVSDRTRKKVLNMAKEMNYSPNVVAKNLSSKKQKTIAMITSGYLNSESLDNSNTSDLLKGVYRATEEKDYELTIYLTDTEKQQKKDYAKYCTDRNIRGVVLSGIRLDDPYFKALLKTKIPCVLVDVKTEKIENELIGSVSTNNIQASYDIAKYVINNGHKKLLIVAGTEKADVNTERLKGIRKACREQNIHFSESNIIYGNFKEDITYNKLKDYFSNKNKIVPTAVICFSDIMALGALKALRELNFNVPGDISLTGFDGLKINEYTNPTITTIKQDFQKLGYQAATLLQNIMEGKLEKREVVVPHELLLFESVKKIN